MSKMEAESKDMSGQGDATPFGVLVDLLEAVICAKKGANKRKHLRTFFDLIGKDYFACMRLILPELDKERGNYGLGSEKLAKCIAEALGLVKEAPDYKKLVEWRRGGTKRAGKSAGNFALVAAEVLESRQRVSSTGLTIRAVNDLLDRLVLAEKREAKNTVMTELINKTNSREMKWVVMIILKDMKLGVSEKTVFSEFHPDAEDLFNVTCDLKGLCEKLSDRSQRFKRQDIEIGRVVRPQLAARVATVEQGLKKLRGKEVLEECKFDGDRIQLHKDGAKLFFFSRNAVDHTEQYEAILGNVIKERVRPSRCILDGEMLVWNRATNRFTAFGQNRSVAKDMKEGLERDEQLCYMSFDILYYEDHSVIHRPLRERHEVLQAAVAPLPGTLELLVPGHGINTRPGGVVWSILPSGLEEANEFFFEMVENRDEGVILKDLDSRWEPADRSGRWVKVKPDYINVETDLDVLIIGGYYGRGKRGGEVAQFLLGIAERPRAGGYPSRFYTFCKVGTGYTNEELGDLRHRLSPYWRAAGKATEPPRFYISTKHHQEWPDLWIDQPEKSVILQIKSDIRTISTEVFATKYSLRFPRVSRIRYDKPWYDCLDKEALEEIVAAGGSMDRTKYTALQEQHTRHKRTKGGAAPLPLVPLHLQTTDVSTVTQHSTIFKDTLFYFVNVPSEQTRDAAHRLVVEHGGRFSMNLIPAVTHVIADRKEGPRYIAAVKHGDVIHFTWLLTCVGHKKLLPVKPKYYLHLSEDTREALSEQMDAFGDSYTERIDGADLAQLLANMAPTAQVTDAQEIAALEAEHSRDLKYGIFRGCTLNVPPLLPAGSADQQAVAQYTLARVRLEAVMHGGCCVSTPSMQLTHLVLYNNPDDKADCNNFFTSLGRKERLAVSRPLVQVVAHQWVEACVAEERLLDPAGYSMRHALSLSIDDDVGDHSGGDSGSLLSKESARPSPQPPAKKPRRGAPRGATRKRGRAEQGHGLERTGPADTSGGSTADTMASDCARAGLKNKAERQSQGAECESDNTGLGEDADGAMGLGDSRFHKQPEHPARVQGDVGSPLESRLKDTTVPKVADVAAPYVSLKQVAGGESTGVDLDSSHQVSPERTTKQRVSFAERAHLALAR